LPSPKVRVCLRFRQYELAALEGLAEWLGIPSLSRLTNMALEFFLSHSPSLSSRPCSKRRVTFLIDELLAQKLNRLAELSGTSRTELIRLALKVFSEKTEPCRLGRTTEQDYQNSCHASSETDEFNNSEQRQVKRLKKGRIRFSRDVIGLSDLLGPVEFMRDEDLDEFESTRDRIVRALKELEGYDPVLDLPLVEEVARSAIYVKHGERFLDGPSCSPATYAAVSDAMAKHASRMRAAIKQLASGRAERLRFRSASKLVAEIKAVIDKVTREG